MKKRMKKVIVLNNVQTNARNIHIASFWFNIKATVIASFFTVYLLRLNATPFQLSLFEVLTAFAGIISLLAFSIYLDSSKKSFLKFTGFDRLAFLALSILMFLIRDPLLVIIGFGLYCIPYTIASVLSPNFMKDAIPESSWGKVFSTNKVVLIITNMVTLCIVGWLLDVFKYAFPYSFIIIFIASSIVYALSYYFLRKVKVDGNIQIKRPRLGRIELLAQVDKNLLLMVLVNIFIFMIAPLWSIYHVNILHLSNFQIGLLTLSYSIGCIVGLPYWGKLLDNYSNKKALIIVSFLMFIIPINYVLTRSYVYLLFAQFISGCISGGFDLIIQNNLMYYAKQSKYDYAYMSDFQLYQNITRLGFPALGIMIYSYIGITATFILTGLLRLITAFVIWYIVKDEIKENRQELSLES